MEGKSEWKLGGTIRPDGRVESEVDADKGGVVEIPAVPPAIDTLELEMGSVLMDLSKVLKN